MVIFTAIPFDVYYYEVLRAPVNDLSENPPQAGDMMTVNVPRKPDNYRLSLPMYNRGVPEEHQIEVNHTLGNPKSYYTRTQRDEQKTAAGSEGLFSTTTKMTAGGGQGSTTINIESVQGKESSFTFDLETEIAAEIGIGGATAGVSAAFNYGYETTSSVSEGTWIEGTVPAIPDDYYTFDRDFSWGLMAYPRSMTQNLARKYIFVTYWVD
jgi:hypothetical protein